MQTIQYVNAEDIQVGDVIAKHGYTWIVRENRYDAIGNATMSEAPMPRRILRVEFAETEGERLAPIGYRAKDIELGYEIGQPIVARLAARS